MLLLAATATLLPSCSDDKDKPDNATLSKTSYTMHQAEKQSIEGNNISDIAWDSENEFVATVKDGVITGTFVGKTNVKSSTGNLTFSVEVTPKYNLYEEPCMDWGISKDELTSKQGTPYSETEDILFYTTSSNDVPVTFYMFKNNKLYCSGALGKASVAESLLQFLGERYVPIEIDSDDLSATFAHCYGKISDPHFDYGVAMQYKSEISGFFIVYLPNNDSATRSLESFDNSEMIKVVKELLK